MTLAEMRAAAESEEENMIVPASEATKGQGADDAGAGATHAGGDNDS